MISKEVIMCLCEDMEKIELPPISEKVFQALSKQRQKYIEYTKKVETLNKQKNDKIKKYAFAAMLALLAISVPVVVVLTNHAPISDLPNAPVSPGSSEAASVSESQIATSTPEIETTETALEHIKLKQSYGEVALSDKSEEELEMLLVTYSKENSAYEDGKYIYNFDSQGRLLEMRKTVFGDEEGQPVDEQTISSNVNALLKEYYPDWLENECDITIEKNEDSRPAWKVYVTQSTDSFTKNILTVTFDKLGLLQGIVLDGSADNMGIISKAEAVEIVLRELRSSKYTLPEFENEEVEITVNIKAIDNKQYYEVNVDKIPYVKVNSEVYFAGYLFLVDSETGEHSLVAHSP